LHLSVAKLAYVSNVESIGGRVFDIEVRYLPTVMAADEETVK
jgi:hypothetical protein